jgi:hypothetical protein
MKLKSWLAISRLALVCACTSLMPVLFFGIVMVKVQIPKGILSMSIIGTMIGFCVSIFTIIYISGKLDMLRSYFGIRDLNLVARLSPGELEDLCLKRLRELATQLQEVQAQLVPPYGNPFLVARAQLKAVHVFFTEQGFIPDTPWERFFPKPETQK